MRPHLHYLRYVLLHKWYVAKAGIEINGWSPRWLWRLLIHDLSKFRPSEWSPYVTTFYGAPTREPTTRALRMSRFDRAWLLHIHRNPHHWQHWLLREDSGGTKALLQPSAVVDEMVADWLAAGQKILQRPSLAECVAETIVWYVTNRNVMVLREPARQRVEQILMGLANDFGLVAPAMQLHVAQAARQTITLAGRS